MMHDWWNPFFIQRKFLYNILVHYLSLYFLQYSNVQNNNCRTNITANLTVVSNLSKQIPFPPFTFVYGSVYKNLESVNYLRHQYNY